jgi:PPOX class probable FMN-dependent enzyme
MTATIAPARGAAAAADGDGFDNQFTRQFGMPVERVQKKVKGLLSEDVQAFIRQSPFLVMATADARGNCDASPKGGKPGFVAILDERHVLVPDVAGNRLFHGYQNMATNPHVALLFIIPGSERTARVNGRVTIVDSEEVGRRHAAFRDRPDVSYRDDNTKTLQGIVVEVEEAYTHCPRAFKFADLWDAETIAANKGG